MKPRYLAFLAYALIGLGPTPAATAAPSIIAIERNFARTFDAIARRPDDSAEEMAPVAGYNHFRLEEARRAHDVLRALDPPSARRAQRIAKARARTDAAYRRAYERVTLGAFVCDDEPWRCGEGATPSGVDAGEPWSCDTHFAEGELPRPGCKYETQPERRTW